MKNPFFPEIHGKFGFGCMRFPKIGDELDYDQISRMADAFLAAGLNYFDTAHGYHSGLSETALKRCLTSRHDRSEYLLTDKLTGSYFKTEAEIRPLFEAQLEACGVEYFDFYLMHAQNARNFEQFKACRAYETAFELKREGKIRHVGLSFHDTAEVLDKILTAYPEVEVVQIQLNYLDYGDVAVDSKRVYETCVRHGKPVIVMEPIKGGTLVKGLPEDAVTLYEQLGQTPASMALRFAAGFEQVAMVLSGMSDLDQMNDNLSFMVEPKPLNELEGAAIEKVRDLFRAQNLIPCTACRYCTDGCPMGILIPDIFSCLNKYSQFKDWNQPRYYRTVLTEGHGKASECLKCGLCESVCPQNLPIRDLLEKAVESFEKEDD